MSVRFLIAGLITILSISPAFAQGVEGRDVVVMIFPAAIILIVILILVSGYYYWLSCKTARLLQRIYPLYSHYASEAYFYWDAKRDHEAISDTLAHLLDIPITSRNFSAVTTLMKNSSAKQLEDTYHALREAVLSTYSIEDTIDNFTLQLKTPKNKEDKRHYFEAQGKALKDTQGCYTGIYICFKEITHITTGKKQLEEKNIRLENELHRFSEMFDAAPYPIFQRDSNCVIRYCNVAYRQCVDGDRASSSNAVKELGKSTRELANTALASSKVYSERHHIIVNGERKLYEITETPAANSQSLYGYAIDKSDSEKLKLELDLNISAQNCLLESSASAMALYGFDKQLKSYNNAFISLWDLDEQWLETQPTYGEVLEAQREKRKLPEQANFPAFKKRHLQFFNELRDPHNEFFYLPDGTALRVIVIPHALGGLLFAYEDMTDRLAIERSYNTLIAVQRATLDNLHEGVAVFGQNGRIKLFNPMYAKMWGLDVTMLESEPHMSHILEHTKHFYKSGEDWLSFKEHIIRQSTSRQSSEQCFERMDGVVLDWVSVPLPDGATLMTYIDITDSTLVERSLRERNEALQGADRIKTEFLANVSYELRSPLTTIVGYSQMLQEDEDKLDKKHREYVHDIQSSSHYLMALINDVLDLASIEAGQMTLDVNEVDVYQLLLSVLPLVSERVKESNLTLHLECSETIGSMIADDRRIKQLVFKLLSNAIKFTDEGGTITFGADSINEDELVVWVQDTGVGIPLEEHEAVFKKFYKTEASKALSGGTGLGLSVVKNFMMLHGGRITITSTPGKGARFNCFFHRCNSDLLQSKENSFDKSIAS